MAVAVVLVLDHEVPGVAFLGEERLDSTLALRAALDLLHWRLSVLLRQVRFPSVLWLSEAAVAEARREGGMAT